MAAAIPEAQVRLFGSRTRGTAQPDSDVDLLITVPNHWRAGRDRVRVLGDFWRQYPLIGFLLICFFIPKAK
ncbi:MAG: nucleotidyltransferase domain-containing protein [Synechococcaceae cyanobacterium]|jgi:predicted nucleotidyltransferase